MVRIRTSNDIILSTLDFYRANQPQLDTKPGAVARDLLVDGPATQLARVYEELARIRSSQSLRLSLGIDLDRLASNYGAIRKQGSKASGTGLFTFNVIDTDIPITKGDVVSANNGATFVVTISQTVTAIFANRYRATASKFRADLDFVGIADQFAVEVSLESTANGQLGNISKYALVTTSTAGVSNVTNTTAFGGGSQAEDDAAFRNRILAIFSGANTGTATGYRNTVLGDPATLDAVVIGPGDPLMTRDGTQVNIAEDGTRTIISEGTGGKVDIYVFGIRLVEILDSYIYRDQSNKDDPTDPANDFVLGQIPADAGKTVTRKRIDDLATGVLPDQPVNNLIAVSGSLSGSNFVEKQTDSLGRVTGNYELLRDTGAFAGSPWGFDKLHWISNQITNFSEDLTKGRFNGQDAVTFSDVLKISGATQQIQIVNENSIVNPNNRSSIQLAHYPITSVSRVFNLTTGERYVISNQNPDGSDSLNTTGRILISGGTLPAVSDTLQVDYIWQYSYDPNFDFDNRVNGTNPRSVVDSIDWGFSNAVRREQATVLLTGVSFNVVVTHPISSVISVNTFLHADSVVQLVQGRLAVVVTTAITNVVSVIRDSDGAELFATGFNNGTFSGLTIFLPTDSVAEFGDAVSVIYNANDVFTVNGVSGSFNDNLITLPSTAAVSGGQIVECNYIANVRTLLPVTLLPALPAVRSGNGFNTTASTGIGVQPFTNVYSSGAIIQNLRMAPSRLQLNISGTISPGVITVSGTTFTAVFDSVITASSAGLKFNLSSAIRTALGLSSTSSIPTNVELIRVISVEKVTTSSSLDVLTVEHVYEVKGYKLRNNSFVKSESVTDSLLSATEFELPPTTENEVNAPNIGERLQITFYISKTNDSENVSFSKSGTLYTNKVFALIDTIAISSGFTSASSQSAGLTVSNQNQPASGTRYNGTYDYLAPKTNERISITYNFNKLIVDSTLAIEEVRPISADVLVKSATPILVDATLNIVVAPGFENSSNIVQQNVRDAITSALNATNLGTIVDASDLIQAAYTVSGVDRVRILFFNVDGMNGSTLSVEAEKNEYIQANIVTVNIESR